jgi:hypothetical protein
MIKKMNLALNIVLLVALSVQIALMLAEGGGDDPSA